MILSFKTKINGKPTYFVEKIWAGLFNLETAKVNYMTYLDWGNTHYERDFKPKIHTIREDKKNLWEKGMMIDFFINARQKNMFRFAPRIPVKKVQKIYMSYAYGNIIEISINGREINDWKVKEQIAINDGFDSWDDFVDYFYPIIQQAEDQFFIGKIIHWTDLKY